KLEPGEERAPSEDLLESRLVKIWEEVFNLRSIDVRQNFFELGGDSLLAVRLMHRVKQSLGKSLPLATLFQAPTIEQLTLVLRREGWSPTWSSLVPIQPNGSKPPFFCVHGVGGTAYRFHHLASQLGSDQPFYGLQAQGLDGRRPRRMRVEEMAS